MAEILLGTIEITAILVPLLGLVAGMLLRSDELREATPNWLLKGATEALLFGGLLLTGTVFLLARAVSGAERISGVEQLALATVLSALALFSVALSTIPLSMRFTMFSFDERVDASESVGDPPTYRERIRASLKAWRDPSSIKTAVETDDTTEHDGGTNE
ncbi:hypothetical protein JCM17823_25590 [Halorubrum gandharaense]